MKGLLATLMIKLGLDDKEFKSGINNAKNEGNKFGNAISKIGGLIAGAFAVQKIVAFGKELIGLSGVAEGVKAAFDRIADATTLRGLQEATKGTVSQLELMKRTVTANNLGIPIENLASLFEFATKRAQETGQSVDYLVDSIVLGIGRKSPLILDNLGISAIQLRAKLKGVGTETASVAQIAAAVGEIASDSMRESGGVIDTNAIKLQSLGAKWDDIKLKISQTKLFTDSLSDSLTKAQKMFYVWASDNATFWEKAAISVELFDKRAERLYQQVKKRDEEQAEIDRKNEQRKKDEIELNNILGRSVNNLTKEQKIAAEKAGKAAMEEIRLKKEQGRTITELEEETAKLKETLKTYGEFQTKEIQKTLLQIDANEKLIQSLTTLNEVQKRDTTPISPMQGISGGVKVSSPFGEQALEMDKINNLIDQNTQKAEELYQRYFAAWDSFKQDMAYSVADFGVNVVSQLGEALGQLAATGEFPADFGKNVLFIIGSFISQLGKMLLAMGIAASGFQALLDSAFTSPPAAALAIAGGLALIAAGSFFQGMAKAGPTGAGGGVGGGGGGNTVSSQPYSAVNPMSGKGFEGVTTLNLSGVLKGDSIYISNERNAYKRSVVG